MVVVLFFRLVFFVRVFVLCFCPVFFCSPPLVSDGLLGCLCVCVLAFRACFCALFLSCFFCSPALVSVRLSFGGCLVFPLCFRLTPLIFLCGSSGVSVWCSCVFCGVCFWFRVVCGWFL